MPALPLSQLRKASGSYEPFDEHKLRASLYRARIPAHMHDRVVQHVQAHLSENSSSADILQLVQDYFRDEYAMGFCRYNLKQAIMRLGPSGYPFERFVGELLKYHGYSVQVGLIIPGRCVSHEVDVLAQKDQEKYVIECKFHSQPGIRSDVKITLYVQARYQDILARWKAQNPNATQDMYHQAWVVTNTKCTSDALAYADCMGMRVIGWNYPRTGNLQDLIESSGLYPITCLSSLSQRDIETLLQKEIVLAKDITLHNEEARKLVQGMAE